jgi:hypothetical protein
MVCEAVLFSCTSWRPRGAEIITSPLQNAAMQAQRTLCQIGFVLTFSREVAEELLDNPVLNIYGIDA